MTDNRLVTGAKKETDAFEATIRPQSLGEFIGQEQARANLEVFIKAAKARGFDPVPDELGVDAGVDNEMGDMDVLRPEFAGHGLRHVAQACFCAGEGGVAYAAAEARGRAGKEDRAFAMLQHEARGFAAGEEAAIARHLPDLAINLRRRLRDVEADIRADVEDDDL